MPGGHKEDGETILTTAKRELYEETGSIDYSIKQNKAKTFGILYYADISKFKELPDFEMDKIELFDSLPENWTYPEIQPKLIEKVSNFIGDEMEFD